MRMRKFFQSPISWLAVFCAVLSAGLWEWSRRLPESNWESSAAVSLPSPTAEPGPTTGPEPTTPLNADPSEAAPAPTSTPALAEVSPPAPTPSATETVAAATPTPAASTPPPSDAELAGPLPAHAETAATPPPSPTPPTASIVPDAPLDLGEIARQPQLWPRQVVLLASVRFPVILKGVNVGNIQVPPGRPVLLRKVDLDGSVEIELQGSLTKVKAQTTDILARAQAIAAARKSAAPTP